MIYVISKIQFIKELNPSFIQTSFFVVKNVGLLFQNKVNIPMVAQEIQNNKLSSKLSCKKKLNNYYLRI